MFLSLHINRRTVTYSLYSFSFRRASANQKRTLLPKVSALSFLFIYFNLLRAAFQLSVFSHVRARHMVHARKSLNSSNYFVFNK